MSEYCCLTYDIFTDIHVTQGIKGNNPRYEESSHKSDIDFLYKQICDVWIQPVKSEYHLAKLIIIWNTLYLVVMSM